MSVWQGLEVLKGADLFGMSYSFFDAITLLIQQKMKENSNQVD